MKWVCLSNLDGVLLQVFTANLNFLKSYHVSSLEQPAQWKIKVEEEGSASMK